ncbi:MAG: site-2 protease family protein [Planctomycetota bacterium]|jgi:Zn-dependent protease
MDNPIYHILFWGGFIYSIIAHEVAHAWVALKMGDDTAARHGRITANPIPHIDPIWSIAIPLMMYISSGGGLIFGGAKPVPVNPLKFRRIVRGDVLVSIAGVTANFLIAFVCSLLVRFYLKFGPETVTFHVFMNLMIVNLFLMIFNLLPIPPLDGSHLFAHLLPEELRDGYRRIGFFGIFIVLMVISIPLVNNFMWGIIVFIVKWVFMFNVI